MFNSSGVFEKNMRAFLKIMSSLCIILLTACKNMITENSDADLMNKKDKRDASIGKLFGDDALNVGGDDKAKFSDGSIIGVNAYLWRASLEAIAFMPLNSVDPFGGVILTDWYTPQESPHERIKVNIRILDRQLKVTAIKVSIFRQKNENGMWVDQPIYPATARKLEDAILTRAQEMKVEAGA